MTNPELDPAAARSLAAALTALLDAARFRVVADSGSELVSLVTDHVGCPLGELSNVAMAFPAWEHANLQRGVDAYLAEYSPDARWFGPMGSARSHQDIMDMLAAAAQHGSYQLGAVDHDTVAVGPDAVTEAVTLGLVRTVAPDRTPVVIAVRGPTDYHESCQLRVLAAERATATAVRDEVERLMRAHDVFRGQVLLFDVTAHRGNQLVSFLPRPHLAAREVVLPPGVLDTIERHVVRTAASSDRLAGHGQHLKRGLLLYGPPGTGKTHTVRYLLGRLADATSVVLSGRAMRFLPDAAALVRRLAPAVLVIEDVDLVAEDRSFSHGPTPLLFELLNLIDGVDADVDVTFVLTTNRVDVLERALADRPGRVDLAVEIPRPDAAGRERLLRLYAAGVALDLANPAPVVAGTDGVTASFMREMVRRAVVRELELHPDRPVRLDGDRLAAALTELTDERHALTRRLLGAAGATGTDGTVDATS